MAATPAPKPVPPQPDGKEDLPVVEDFLEFVEEDEEESDEMAEVQGSVTPVGEQLAAVTVKDPQGHETVFSLDRGSLTFGRSSQCDVVIADKKCSRKHFTIEKSGDYFLARDAGSTNKLRIRGRKLATRRLRDGDVIVIGGFKIEYRGPTDESAPDELDAAPLVSSGEGEEHAEGPQPSEEGDTVPISEPLPAPVPEEAEPVDDAQRCPKCQIPMPENAPCTQCGHKSLVLQAQEHFVDTVAKGNSIWGGIGLWALKRKRALETVQGQPKVEWVLQVGCPGCGKRHRVINEFRVKFIQCEQCGMEISLPVHQAPRLE